jgi:hypothetical protein
VTWWQPSYPPRPAPIPCAVAGRAGPSKCTPQRTSRASVGSEADRTDDSFGSHGGFMHTGSPTVETLGFGVAHAPTGRFHRPRTVQGPVSRFRFPAWQGGPRTRSGSQERSWSGSGGTDPLHPRHRHTCLPWEGVSRRSHGVGSPAAVCLTPHLCDVSRLRWTRRRVAFPSPAYLPYLHFDEATFRGRSGCDCRLSYL